MTITNLTSVVDTISRLVIERTNEKLTSPAFMDLYGVSLSDMMDGSDQQTQDTTKFLQYILNAQIVNVMTEMGIDGYKDETTGRDYMICGLPVEFKLMGGSSSSSFATGNKTSHFGGAKTNLVWTIKYTLENGVIDSYSSVLVDTNLIENPWASSTGRKDSYSTLKVKKTESDAILYVYGLVTESRKFLHLNTIPVTG